MESTAAINSYTAEKERIIMQNNDFIRKEQLKQSKSFNCSTVLVYIQSWLQRVVLFIQSAITPLEAYCNKYKNDTVTFTHHNSGEEQQSATYEVGTYAGNTIDHHPDGSIKSITFQYMSKKLPTVPAVVKPIYATPLTSDDDLRNIMCPDLAADLLQKHKN